MADPQSSPEAENPIRTPEEGAGSFDGADSKYGVDRELVRAVLEGSLAAWEELVQRYSGLIISVIRRYLHSRDGDDVRTIYVSTLQHLHESKLVTYAGRSSLATWIVVVARTETLDFLRHRFGRHQTPGGLEKLSVLERDVFRYYYIEGVTLDGVEHRLQQAKQSLSRERILTALRRIEEKLDNRSLRRLTYDLHAQSVGAATGRLLEFLDHVRAEYDQTSGAHSPEYHLMEREARQTVENVQRLIATLSRRDQQALTLRFERGWTAEQIAEELGLPSKRNAYTLLDRIVRNIRKKLKDKE